MNQEQEDTQHHLTNQSSCWACEKYMSEKPKDVYDGLKNVDHL